MRRRCATFGSTATTTRPARRRATGGIACHTGRVRCFFQRLEQGAWVEAEPVLKDPAAIYGHD
jgi:hypothetical protein